MVDLLRFVVGRDRPVSQAYIRQSSKTKKNFWKYFNCL